MAVENKYVDTLVANTGAIASSISAGGAGLIVMVHSFEVAAADDDGSIYRIAKSLPPNLIPIRMEVFNDAITGGTDYDIGLYATDLGTVIDKDVFADGLSMASARGAGAPGSGITTLDVANLARKLYEHAGHTVANKLGGYDLAVTANTVGSAAGTITVISYFAQG